MRKQVMSNKYGNNAQLHLNTALYFDEGMQAALALMPQHVRPSPERMQSVTSIVRNPLNFFQPEDDHRELFLDVEVDVITVPAATMRDFEPEAKDMRDGYNELAAVHGGNYALLDLRATCHYLLNTFLYLSKSENLSDFTYYDDVLNTMFVMLYECVMKMTYDYSSPDEKVFDKIRQLMGITPNLPMLDVVDKFARDGVTTILGNIKRQPIHFMDVYYFPYKLAYGDEYTKDYKADRYEMQNVVRKVQVHGGGVFFGPKYKDQKFSIPKNVAQIHELLLPFEKLNIYTTVAVYSVSYHDFLECLRKIYEIRDHYQPGQHFLHTYKVFDVTKIIERLEEMRDKYNPVKPETLTAIDGINARYGLGITRPQTGLLPVLQKMIAEYVEASHKPALRMA